MLGPMFGFTEDDLVRLRARSRQVQAEPDKKPARISLYGALLLALEAPADDPFTEKVKDFYAHLTALRQMARSAPAEQLLEEILPPPVIWRRWAFWKTVPAAGRMPAALPTSAPLPVQAASRRWCALLMPPRRPAAQDRTLCPAGCTRGACPS